MSEELKPHEALIVERRLGGLKRFLEPDSFPAPVALRPGVSSAAWRAMPTGEREDTIRAALAAEVLAFRAEREARAAAEREARWTAEAAAARAAAEAPAPAPAEVVDDAERERRRVRNRLRKETKRAQREATEADAPVDDAEVPVAATGSVVACLGGCGAWLPATPGRPTYQVCSPGRQPSRRRSKPGVPGSPKARRTRMRATCGARQTTSHDDD